MRLATSTVCVVGLILVAQARTANAGLVAHWPLNEGSGVVFADVAGGNDGYLPEAEFGDVAEIDWGEGPPTQTHAVDFLGFNSFIATNFPGIESDGARTVSFWFKTLDSDAYFLGWGSNATSEKWHIRLNGGNGVMRTEFQGGQNFATTDLIDDEWHHVASVFPDGASEGAEILHYVDGILDEQAGGTSLPIDTSIGSDEPDWTDAESPDPYFVHFGGVLAHGFGRMLEGSMADVRIYDEGLSEERILAIMEGRDPGGVITDPCIPLDDGSLTEVQARIDYVHNTLGSWMGDSNKDGEFNSGDLVTVFTAGLYETDAPAKWATGDWNGDGVFGSADLVVAFSDGGYELGPRPDMQAVPEPSGLLLLTLGLIGCLRRTRGVKRQA